MIWPFKRKLAPLTRAYKVSEGGVSKCITAGDASAAAEDAFPCSRGVVFVKVIGTGEKFALYRRSQLDRWGFDEPPLPAPPTGPTCLPQPRPLPTGVPRPGPPSMVLR